MSLNLKRIEHQCPRLNLSQCAYDVFEEDALVHIRFAQPFLDLSCDDFVARRVWFCILASSCPRTPYLACFEPAFGVNQITEDLACCSHWLPIRDLTLLQGFIQQRMCL